MATINYCPRTRLRDVHLFRQLPLVIHISILRFSASVENSLVAFNTRSTIRRGPRTIEIGVPPIARLKKQADTVPTVRPCLPDIEANAQYFMISAERSGCLDLFINASMQSEYRLAIASIRPIVSAITLPEKAEPPYLRRLLMTWIWRGCCYLPRRAEERDGPTGAQRQKTPEQFFKSFIESVQKYAEKTREQSSPQQILDELDQIHIDPCRRYHLIRSAVNHVAPAPPRGIST